MKQICLMLVVLFAGITTFAQNKGDRILGNWLSEDKDGKIQVYKEGDKYFGKLIWSQHMFEKDGVTSRKDEKNSNPDLRNRNLKDLVILTDMEFDGDDSYSGGKIYDPKSGKTYSCNMRLKGDKIDIRGFVGVSLFGRTSVWTRTE